MIPFSRRRSVSRPTLFAVCLGLGLVSGGGALFACNVPVFRYALERWLPDPYRATVFHRGPLTDEQRAKLAAIDGEAEVAAANVVVRAVDVAELDWLRLLLDKRQPPTFPWLVIQYPRASRIDRTIWAGPLAGDEVKKFVDSPTRQELIRQLSAGQTAVWLLLECSDAKKNDVVAKLLEVELLKLSISLKLPELTSAPEDSLLSEMPLKIAFSIMRMKRDVPVERGFVEVLLHAEDDLLGFDEPMVFPIFGRGRALMPLVGQGITSDNLYESASFLVGACSCEIKELNPGFDLPLAVDWNELLYHGAPPKAVLGKPVAMLDDKPELVQIPAGAAPVQPSVPSQTAAATTTAAAHETGPAEVASPPTQGSHLPVVFAALAAAIGLTFAFKRLL